MARFESDFGRLAIRLAGCLALVGMTSSASAQIGEADRIARCENNRARMVEIQAAWPRGPAGWSDQQIATARLAQARLRQRWGEIFVYGANELSDQQKREQALQILTETGNTLLPLGMSCYPLGYDCEPEFDRQLSSGLAEAERAAPRRAALLQQFNVYRTNYLALECLRGAVAQNSTSDIGFAMMTGTFDSTFGTLTLSTGGGSYDYYGGQIRVTGISGNVMEGTWTQTRSGNQCPDGQHRGRFRFQFDASGFRGSYSYCDGEGGGPWNGRRRQ